MLESVTKWLTVGVYNNECSFNTIVSNQPDRFKMLIENDDTTEPGLTQIFALTVWQRRIPLNASSTISEPIFKHNEKQNRKTGHNDLLYHGLRGSASPVLTATGFVNGRWQFSTPYRINTPWPITKKFGTGDYVGGPYGCAKFGANPSMGLLGK